MFKSISDVHLAASVIGDRIFDVGSLVQRGIAQGDDREGTRVRLPGVHASEVAKCVRQATYTARGIGKRTSPSADMQARFNIGHAVHSVVQGALKKIKLPADAGDIRISFEEEIEVGETDLGKELNLHSSCDGVFTFSVHGEPVVRIGLEIKTESATSWIKRKAPDPGHIDQALVYMAALDLPMMYFAYINKESGQVTPFLPPFAYAFDMLRWGKVRERIQLVNKHAKDGTLPEPEQGFHCTFCPYEPLCQPGGSVVKFSKWSKP